MRAIVDTSSLLNLVRYYLPFDRNGRLKDIFQAMFESGELIVIDKVQAESRNINSGLIKNTLGFIFSPSHARYVVQTPYLLPDAQFYKQLENDFCNHSIVRSKRLTEAEVESEKNRFVDTADAKIILYAIKIYSQSPIVITEESLKQNDGKVFKKIPSICSILNVPCVTLPVFMKDKCGLNLGEIL